MRALFSTRSLASAMVLLALFLALGIYLRIETPEFLGQWVVRDMVRGLALLDGKSQALAGSELSWGGQLPGGLLHAIYALVFSVSATFEAAFTVNLALNLGSAALPAFFIARYFGRRTAIAFFGLVMLCGMHIEAGAWPFNPSYLFPCMAISLSCLMIAYFDRRPWFYAAAIVVGILSSHFHMSGLFLLAPTLFLAATDRRFQWQHLAVTAGLAFLTFLPYLVFLQIYTFPEAINPKGAPGGAARLDIAKLAVTLCLALFLVWLAYRQRKHPDAPSADRSRRLFPITLIGGMLLIILGEAVFLGGTSLWGVFNRVFLGDVYFNAVSALQGMLEMPASGVFPIVPDWHFDIVLCVVVSAVALGYLISAFRPLTDTAARKVTFTAVLLLIPLPMGLAFGGLVGPHAWYVFFLVFPAMLFTAHALSVCGSMVCQWSGGGTFTGMRIPGRIALVVVFAVPFIVMGTASKMRVDNLADVEPDFAGDNLPGIYDMFDYRTATTLLQNLHDETGLTVDQYSTRVYFNLNTLNNLSNVQYQYIVEGRLSNTPANTPDRPATFTDSAPCLFVDLRTSDGANMGETARSGRERLLKTADILDVRDTKTFVITTYRPSETDFCYTNTRADWIRSPKQLLMRQSLDPSVEVQRLTGDEGEPGGTFVVYWAEQQFSAIVDLGIAMDAGRSPRVQAVFDTDLASGRGVVIWDQEQSATLFANATLVYGMSDGTSVSVPTVKSYDGAREIFGKGPGFKSWRQWLSYFPISIDRAVPVPPDQISSVAVKIEFFKDDSTMDSKTFTLVERRIE